jgi:hypothetical protein
MNDDFDVLADGAVVGRILKVAPDPPWERDGAGTCHLHPLAGADHAGVDHGRFFG